MLEYVKEYFKINDVEYKENKKLKDVSPIKIGGAASIVAYPDCEKKLVSTVCHLESVGCKYKVLGRMSNVLPADGGFDGVIVRTDRIKEIAVEGNKVRASAGATLSAVFNAMACVGLGGFEELCGIPGSVGASVVGNAGAFGREISELLVSLRCYFISERSTEMISKDKILFGYRESSLKNTNCLVLTCDFVGTESDALEIIDKSREIKDKRRTTQPFGIPSLGSTFKKTKEGLSAGYLIEKCGLKGFSVGGAEISNKHAGFIVNRGGATASDYLSVADAAERAVKQKFSVTLEKEIEIL